MKYFMVRCDYEASAWRALMESDLVSHTSRLQPVRDLARRFDGAFVDLADKDEDGELITCKFVGFGGTDLIGIVKFPTDADARAFSMVVSAEPGVKNFEITPLLTMREGVDAMKQAQKKKSTYAAPG